MTLYNFSRRSSRTPPKAYTRRRSRSSSYEKRRYRRSSSKKTLKITEYHSNSRSKRSPSRYEKRRDRGSHRKDRKDRKDSKRSHKHEKRSFDSNDTSTRSSSSESSFKSSKRDKDKSRTKKAAIESFSPVCEPIPNIPPCVLLNKRALDLDPIVATKDKLRKEVKVWNDILGKYVNESEVNTSEPLPPGNLNFSLYFIN